MHDDERPVNPWVQRGIVHATGYATDLVFRKLNHTTILGRCPVGPLPRTVIFSNHQSLIDSFLVGGLMCYPTLYQHPELLHYQLADGRNFMSDPFMRNVYSHLNVIPVGRDEHGNRSDKTAFRKMVRAVSNGAMGHIFIEGTRSRTRELLPPVSSAAGIALLAKADVLPVYFTGMELVQPYRKAIGDPPITWMRFLLGKRIEWLIDMRFGQRITIAFGDVIPAAEVAILAGTTHRAENLAAAIMERLSSLKEEVDRHHYGHTPQRQAL